MGLPTTSLARQQIMVKSHTGYFSFVEKWEDEEWRKFTQEEKYYSILSKWELYYGFEDVLTLRSSFRVFYEKLDEKERERVVYGLGDIVLDAKWNIYNPARELTYAGKVWPEFSIIGGVRIPVKGPPYDSYPLMKYVGTGTGDVEMGGLLRLGNHIGAVYASVIYWHKGMIKGEREAEIKYNFTIEGPKLLEKNYLIFLCELEGSKIGENHLVAICPGIQYAFTYGRGIEIERKVEHEVRFEFSCLIPVEAEGGYKYLFTPFAGVSWKF